jgi:hypothetical protein
MEISKKVDSIVEDVHEFVIEFEDFEVNPFDDLSV